MIAEKTTTELLFEAKRAYHDLALGNAVRVFVDQNGERVEYTSASLSGLKAYIADLTAELANAGDGGRGERPMRVIFG